MDTNKGTAHKQGQHAETQRRYTRVNSSMVANMNECQFKADWWNMMGFRDKVKE